jgi:hypothetical protein
MKLLPMFFGVSLIASSAFASNPPSADQIRMDIAAKGPKVVIDSLDKHGYWDLVVHNIDSGKKSWVELAPLLAPGSDGGFSEDLGIGLAYALPKNPAAVLAAIDTMDSSPANVVLTVSRVCGVPFIEDTVKDIPRYIRQAKAAVSRVDDPALEAVKTACLSELGKP